MLLIFKVIVGKICDFALSGLYMSMIITFCGYGGLQFLTYTMKAMSSGYAIIAEKEIGFYSINYAFAHFEPGVSLKHSP